MISILAVTLVAQLSPSADQAVADDLVFVRGVEEFVIASAPSRRPPEPYVGLIERLGAPSWREREAASRELQEMSALDQRWLFWGRGHADPEVRLRSNTTLRRLNPCPACKGTGSSRNWELWPCSDCQGAATAWPWSTWD
jgi:hypothetical protein